MLFLRSLIFNIYMYVVMVGIGLPGAPAAMVSRNGAYWVMKSYCSMVIWGLRVICGTRVEVRGTPPTSNVIVPSKHQSFLDILALMVALPRAKYVMKREIVWTPIVGFYALRIGSMPVNRKGGRRSMTRMVDDVDRERRDPGQLVIYPQGTRVAPGVKAPYKHGAAVLYARNGLDAAPVATNVGVFWGRHTFYRRPGLAVIEFLPVIPAGLDKQEFLHRLEKEVETASEALLIEGRASLR